MSLDPADPILPVAPPATPWYRFPGVSRREKLLVVLAIVAVLYAVFKKPDTITTVVKETKTVKDVEWRDKKLSKEWVNLRGLAGSTLRILPDGTYELVGPFEMTSTKTQESDSSGHSHEETTHREETKTEPAVAWRVLVKGSVLTPIDRLDPGWSAGVAAHIGRVSLLGLKFEIGAGGEVIRIGQGTFIGPQLLVTF